MEFLQQQVHQEQRLPWWTDAICINQQNIPERNAQVQLMWRVYSNAQYVLVWLGLPDSQVRTVFAILHQLETKDEIDEDTWSSQEHAAELPEGADAACATLDGVEYFQRMWIVPELLNARHIVIQSGELNASWAAYTWLIFNAARASSLWTLHRSLVLNRALKRGFDAARPGTLGFLVYNALMDNQLRQCSDPRDRIFSMLAHEAIRNKMRKPPYLEADYAMSQAEVCVMTIAYWDQKMADEYGWDYVRRPHGRFAEDSRNVVQNILSALEFTSEGSEVQDFLHWLHGIVHDCSITLTSGRRLDCGGPILQHLLEYNDLLLLPDTPALWRVKFEVLRASNLQRRGCPEEGWDPATTCVDDILDPDIENKARELFERVRRGESAVESREQISEGKRNREHHHGEVGLDGDEASDDEQDFIDAADSEVLIGKLASTIKNMTMEPVGIECLEAVAQRGASGAYEIADENRAKWELSHAQAAERLCEVLVRQILDDLYDAVTARYLQDADSLGRSISHWAWPEYFNQ